MLTSATKEYLKQILIKRAGGELPEPIFYCFLVLKYLIQAKITRIYAASLIAPLAYVYIPAKIISGDVITFYLPFVL